MGELRKTITVSKENWMKHRKLKADLLIKFPSDQDLSFTEFANLAMSRFNVDAKSLREIRKRARISR